MKNFVLHVISIGMLASVLTSAWAKPVDVIESEGVYVVAEKGYVKIEAYQHDSSYVDFNHLQEVPFVKRSDTTLKLVVYKKDFSESNILLEQRQLALIASNQPLKFDMKPLAKPHMFEITVNGPIKDGTLIFSHAGFFQNMGAIVLGDTQKELVKLFSQKDIPDAPIVIQFLDDALAAYPNNTELKNLRGYWAGAAEVAKDKKGYSYVEEKWLAYEKAEKLTLKQRYLNDVIYEINAYLNEHPNGIKAEEAKQRKSIAEKKLKEYEKLL